MYIVRILLSYIAKLVLLLIGWKLPKEKHFNQFHKYKRSVVVFSHTSYADFYVFILYILAFPKEFNNVRVLVKPQPFAYAGCILKRLGCIPSSRFDQRNGRSTDRIVEELNKQGEFIFLISPKGTIVKSEWRSGYYNIAISLKAHLSAVGLDYEKKKIIISYGIEYDKNKEEIELFLKEQLSKIVPLFPEDEVFEIRKHNENLRSIINTSRLFLLIFLIVLLFVMLIY